MDRLKDLMKILRDPNGGCPWDAEQTFATLSPYTIEEAYEVDHAIRQNDHISLKEELGDLLLQVVFHAEIGRELGIFDFDEISEGLFSKLVRRHPHVFSEFSEVQTADDQVQLWESLKNSERSQRTGTANSIAPDISDIPLAQPALSRASKLQKRIGSPENPRHTCDQAWTDLERADSQELQEEAIANLLFSVVALAKSWGMDAEEILRKRNAQFAEDYKRSHS